MGKEYDTGVLIPTTIGEMLHGGIVGSFIGHVQRDGLRTLL